MPAVELREEQQSKIYRFLLNEADVYIHNEDSSCNFVEAVLWTARSGSQRRLLPERYGKWNSIYKRSARWEEKKYGVVCLNILLKIQIWNTL